MRIDPRGEARRLLAQVDPADLDVLATDPVTALGVLFDITITTRPPSLPGPGCPVDGTYRPGPPPHIFVADDVTAARQRFTVLHEWGHHLIEHDDYLNDLEISDAERSDENICNEVAATVLLPDDIVDKTLPAGVFTAEHVAALFDNVSASRMACCVAAARRLASPGCVILGTADGTAEFTAHHPATPWRIARGTSQGPDSLLAKAARSSLGKARGVTKARFATGTSSGHLHGDAFAADDGWVFAVLIADSHSPWAGSLNLGLTDTGPDGTEIECPHCGEGSTVWSAPCRRCGDHVCPRCQRCSCEPGPTPTRRCQGSCGLMKPPNQFRSGSLVCVDCE